MSLRACTWVIAFALACSSSSAPNDAATPADAALDATTGGQSGEAGDASSDAELDDATSGQGGIGASGSGGSSGDSGGSGGGSGAVGDSGASDSGGGDASQPEQRCYVEGCNGALDSISSAPGCPELRPELATGCTLPNGAECFYCEPGQDRLLPSDAIPTLVCSGGTWTYDELFSACD